MVSGNLGEKGSPLQNLTDFSVPPVTAKFC